VNLEVMLKFDLVTVYYNEATLAQTAHLRARIAEHEPSERYDFYEVDNTVENRGFAKGCNLGASRGRAEIIGFLNPDLLVHGPFLETVSAVFEQEERVVITGSSFQTPEERVRRWGLRDWVCGAAFFVRRDFFEAVRGFDEQFVWSWEETDLCRRAEAMGLRVLAQDAELPFEHHSPGNDTPYKVLHFKNGARRYRSKWQQPRQRLPKYGPPRASIVIATYGDRGIWDRMAVTAIASAEAQSVPVELIRVHGETLAQARNDGAAKAKTDWLCFLDADDRLPPDYIERCLAGEGDVRVPRVLRFRGPMRQGPLRLTPCDLLVGNYIVIGALTRKSLFEKIGGFSEWPMLEDWELWIRAMKAGAEIRECRGAVYHAQRRAKSRNHQAEDVRKSTYQAIRRLHGAGEKR
jgi:GT2 family glycosyltransferase